MKRVLSILQVAVIVPLYSMFASVQQTLIKLKLKIVNEPEPLKYNTLISLNFGGGDRIIYSYEF